MVAADALLARFNEAPATEVERDLLACCAEPEWARRVVAGRPYPDRGAVLAAADTALRWLPWSGIARALAAHPRIGERPAGVGREAAWSRREQSGVATADAGTRAALAAANADYERRFGHIFLIFASGRTEREVLDAARRRLGHDDETERRVVREELRRIVRLRLERLLTP